MSRRSRRLSLRASEALTGTSARFGPMRRLCRLPPACHCP
jgi:hypothetical protein